ncbi:MAG: hypothetical protein ACYDHP_14425 [Ferrimicrobium sp.]
MVRAENHLSIWNICEEYVGVKWNSNLGCASNQVRTDSVLWAHMVVEDDMNSRLSWHFLVDEFHELE